MKYEKATAEVVSFEENEVFMIMSKEAAIAYLSKPGVCSGYRGVKANGKFTCNSFLDPQDGTYSRSGSSSNYFVVNW